MQKIRSALRMRGGAEGYEGRHLDVIGADGVVGLVPAVADNRVGLRSHCLLIRKFHQADLSA